MTTQPITPKPQTPKSPLFKSEWLINRGILIRAISAQILGLLNKPTDIPKYLYEGRLVPLSKNKGKDQAELKDIRPIVVRSHLAKILEKAIMAKVAALAPHLLQTRIY